MKIGRDIDLIPRYFAQQYPLVDSFGDADERLFSDYTKITAVLVSLTFAEFSLCDSVGYLVRKVGTNIYYVPYNLVPTFPAVAQVQWLEPIISSARLSKSSKFCFSGSSTFLGKLKAIGDLDFCEYIVDVQGVPADVEAKRSEKHLQLVLVKCGKTHATHPFDESILSHATLDAEGVQSLKLDFVLRDKEHTALAVSNVVILTSGELNDSALQKSFLFQEVIVESSEQSPLRSLADAREFGRYANWLKEEVNTYVQKARGGDRHLAVKALKRALSWFLIVGLEHEVQTIIEELDGSRLDEWASIYRAAEVAKLEGVVSTEHAHRQGLTAAPEQDFLGDLLKLAENLKNSISEYLVVTPMEDAA